MQITFHPVQKIEIVVKGEKQEFVQKLLDDSGAAGYTVIHDISGKGHHGFHEGGLIFNDLASLVMIVAVANEEVIQKVAAGLTPLFEKNSGVMFVTSAQVVRPSKFQA